MASLIEYKGKKPILGERVFIAEGAKVIGDVEIPELVCPKTTPLNSRLRSIPIKMWAVVKSLSALSLILTKMRMVHGAALIVSL